MAYLSKLSHFQRRPGQVHVYDARAVPMVADFRGCIGTPPMNCLHPGWHALMPLGGITTPPITTRIKLNLQHAPGAGGVNAHWCDRTASRAFASSTQLSTLNVSPEGIGIAGYHLKDR